MNRHTEYSNIRLKFPKRWVRCDCGCNKEFRFSPMWENKIHNLRDAYMVLNYSIFHANKKKVLEEGKHAITRLSSIAPVVLSIEDIRPTLSKSDYLKLPYNIHVFHININSYDGFHRFYIYRIQEIPNCQASSENPDEALAKLHERLKDMIYKMLSEGIDPPLPQHFDPHFIEWKKDDDLTVHTK